MPAVGRITWYEYRCAQGSSPAAVALLLAAPAAGAGWSPSAAWLAQARCVHAKEGGWTANTGNGYFGGFQFSVGTWRSVGGKPDAAFTHPGDAVLRVAAGAALPGVAPLEARRRHWRSWGAVGASCSG